MNDIYNKRTKQYVLVTTLRKTRGQNVPKLTDNYNDKGKTAPFSHKFEYI